MDRNSHSRAGENYLTVPEEKKLWAHLKRLDVWEARRDYALMRTMRLLGLRRVEAVRLNVGDIYRRERLVIDGRIAAKGAQGVLDIPVELQRELQEYCRHKRNRGESMADDAPLFMSRNGERLAPRTVNYLVEKWCREAGVSITPHGLRHTKGRRIMDDDRYMTPEMSRKRLNLAQKQLRHKSINSTAIYTAPTKEEMALVAGI